MDYNPCNRMGDRYEHPLELENTDALGDRDWQHYQEWLIDDLTQWEQEYEQRQQKQALEAMAAGDPHIPFPELIEAANLVCQP